MSQQSQGTTLFSPADPPTKRKRGRPRKDDSQIQGESSPVMPGSDCMKKNKQIVSASNPAIDDMVGQMVSGVIEGSFDAGYLLNVKVGDTDTQLRGVVFLPGRFTPITAANDVAPNARMYRRKEIPIPVQNLQTQHHDFVPPLEKINKQATESKMEAPKSPDQVPPHEVQSAIPTAGENQSDSAMTPLADKLPMNEAGPSSEEKVVVQKIIESGLENQTASIMAQLKHDKVVEQSQIQQDNVMDVEACKELEPAPAQSEPVSAPLVDLMPCSENVNQEPQVEHQPLSSDPKPSDLVNEDVKSLNIEDSQTAALTKPESLSSEPIGIGLLMDNPNLGCNQTPLSAEPKSISTQPMGTQIIIEKQDSPRKYMPEDALLELANKTIEGDETSLPVGKAANITSGDYVSSLPVGEAANITGGSYDISLPVGEAANITAGSYDTSLSVGEVANITAGGTYSAPMTNALVMMFGGEAISTEAKLGTEESVLPRIIDTQICSSSPGANNDVDPDLKPHNNDGDPYLKPHI